MSKRSGEQARRAALQAGAQRYESLLATRDKRRLAHALRCAATRLETESNVGMEALKQVRPEGHPLAVTDHAVVRFLERVMGFDVEAIRQQISRAVPAHAVPPGVKGSGEHGIYVRDGFQFLLTSGSIISILTAEMNGESWLRSDELDALKAG
jgi:hypothetical protein